MKVMEKAISLFFSKSFRGVLLGIHIVEWDEHSNSQLHFILFPFCLPSSLSINYLSVPDHAMDAYVIHAFPSLSTCKTPGPV